MHLFAAFVLPLRVSCVLALTLIGLLAQLSFFWWVKPTVARGIVTLWSRTMLLCIGVRLDPIGQLDARPALFVSNHISWLDILSLQAVSTVVFVAKSDIKSWPVLGWMVALAGTCFIERERRTALRGIHSALSNHLAAGQSICIFPEGTTSNGESVLPFHAGLLQAAIDAGVPLQPVRLDYSHRCAAYIDDMTLIGSLKSILLTPRLRVSVQLLPTINTVDIGRQNLAIAAHQAIARAARLNRAEAA